VSKKEIIGGAIGLGVTIAAFATGNIQAGGAMVALMSKYVIDRVRAKNSLSTEHQAISVNTVDTETALPIIYGKTRVGLRIVDQRVHPTDSNIVVIVGAIAVASEAGTGIEEVVDVYFDGELAIDGPSWLTNNDTYNPTYDDIQSPWRDSGGESFGTDVWLRYFLHDGDNDQTVDYELKDVFGISLYNNEGTNAMNGVGVAYGVFWMTKENAEDVFVNGVPNITCDVKGMKCVDVTNTGSTTWTEDPASCIYDFMKSTRYGMGIPTAELDLPSFAAASAYCVGGAAQVTPYTGAGSTQDRFRCNGWLDSADSPLENLEKLLSSCRGRIVWENGKFKLIIKQSVTPETYKLTPGAIIGDMEFVQTGIDQTPNSVSATFVDAGRSYQANTVTWPEPGATNDYLTADNDFRVRHSFDLPMTNDYYQAEYTAAQLMLEARANMACSLVAEREALKLSVGSVVEVSHDTPGWDEQPMWVDQVGLRRDGLVQLLLTEYDSTIYGVSAVTEQDDTAASSMPVRYGKGLTTGVQLTNFATEIGTNDDSTGFYQTVKLKLDFSAGLGSFTVLHEPLTTTGYTYTVNHTASAYNDFLTIEDKSAAFKFRATVPGSNTATTYPESPTDITITPYSGTNAGGTAGTAVKLTLEMDADFGHVGAMVQATTLASVVIPAKKILFPATGGMLAGIGTNNNPTVSVNIAGLASHTNVQDSDTMMMNVGGTLYEVAMEDVKTYVNEE